MNILWHGYCNRPTCEARTFMRFNSYLCHLCQQPSLPDMFAPKGSMAATVREKRDESRTTTAMDNQPMTQEEWEAGKWHQTRA